MYLFRLGVSDHTEGPGGGTPIFTAAIINYIGYTCV